MSSFVEKFQTLERVGELLGKGYRFTEIARELNITPAHAKKLADDYTSLVREQVSNDPDFLERLAENTAMMFEQMDLIKKEAWKTYDDAKNFGAQNMQLQALKIAMDVAERQAKLLQLMGAKVDSGSTARLQKAERVNEIVSGIIKDVISGCPRCKREAHAKLAEAFALMDRAEEGIVLNELPSHEHAEAIIDVDPIE
jgi:hypothetical protein